MNYYSKLKPDRTVTGLLPPIIIFSAFLLSIILFDIGTAFKVLGSLILIYSLFAAYCFLKTKNYAFIVQFLYLVFLALWCLQLSADVDSGRDLHTRNTALIGFITIFLLVWLAYLAYNKKLKWKGREILEIAAMPVVEGGDGFTERPRPMGQVGYTKDDLLGFAEFLKRNLVALPVLETNAIVFVTVPMGKEYHAMFLMHRDYRQQTWVSFGLDGHISSHVSKSDYLKFRNALSFDQLCDSLGRTFIEFLELYMEGNESRIVDRLNDIKTNILA